MGWLSHQTERERQALNQWVFHTYEVLLSLERVVGFLNEAELDHAEILFYGDLSRRASRETNIARAEILIYEIEQLVADNPRQGERVRELKRRLEARVAAMRQTEAAIESKGRAAGLRRFREHGLQARQAVLEALAVVEGEERLLLEERLRSVDRLAARNRVLIVIGYAAAFALLILGFWLIAQESVARLRAQRKAEAYAREVEDLYNNAPCGYHSLDADGMFVRVNNTELSWLGYRREELVGRMKFSDFLTPASREKFRDSFPRFKERGRMADLELDLLRKDGSVLPVSLSATAVRDSRGNFVMSRSTLFDLSARRQAEAERARLHEELQRRAVQLEATNRELESFTYSVSHDLRAPLRAIDGFSRILVEEYGDRLDEEGRRLLGIVTDNAFKMGRLIDDLLAFSRMGRKAIAWEKLDMGALAREALAEVRSQFRAEAEIEIAHMPPARGDRALLRQVWVNLISNALKYSSKREHPRVEIGARQEGAETAYYVKDNGVGFDMRHYDKLFGVFQRLHSHEEFSGTGVGLAIVQRIVTRHGGRVWAMAEVDRGAEFYFILPVKEALHDE